jgi:hypothetical protein
LKGLYIFLSDSVVDEKLSLCLSDIDIVEIVEILSVESTEDEHATAQETCTVPSPSLGDVSSYLSSGDLILLRVKDENIIEIITESTPEDINFILVYC